MENAGAFTATKAGAGRMPPAQPRSCERRAERDPHRELDHRDAGDLREEGHGPRRARVHLDEVDAVLADDELRVHQAACTKRDDDPLHRHRHELLVPRRHGLGRIDADRVARVDAGPLQVLEHPWDEDVLTVGDRVHVHLDALEVAIDAHGPVRVDDRRGRELAFEVVG